MKRCAVTILLFGWVLLAAAQTQAGQRRYPPRYQRGSYFLQYTVRPKNGQVTARQVVPGSVNAFPPPAWLYYGYPHSGDGLLSPGF